jgi:protein gp37
MSVVSKIEWTEKTWNPIRARLRTDVPMPTKQHPLRVLRAGVWGYHCERVSPGCQNCYAEAMNGRMLPAWGTGLGYTIPNREKVEIYLDEEELQAPLKWRKPTMVFPCSMTDLFGEWVPDTMLERIWAVMAMCDRHTFQVLTKRADRLDWIPRQIGMAASLLEDHVEEFLGEYAALANWPLPNVWLGVSVEDQQRADERIAHLLQTPAALRWVSYEPALGPVDFSAISHDGRPCSEDQKGLNALTGEFRYYREDDGEPCSDWDAGLDWIVIGGESGSGARPFDLAWAHQTIGDCAAAGVPCFVKQLGALPVIGAEENLHEWPKHVIRDVWSGGDKVRLRHRKGGDPEEWHPALRVRQMPERALVQG